MTVFEPDLSGCHIFYKAYPVLQLSFFPLPAWELILIEDTTLLKDQDYIHSGYMDRCTTA
jgi:hypothetical protein